MNLDFVVVLSELSAELSLVLRPPAVGRLCINVKRNVTARLTCFDGRQKTPLPFQTVVLEFVIVVSRVGVKADEQVIVFKRRRNVNLSQKYKMTAMQVPSGAKSLKNKVGNLLNYKVVPREKVSRRVTPSVYTQEMIESTEDRLANTIEIYPPRILELLDMRASTHHKLSLVDMDQALFQPYPSDLIFQNFTPPQTYQLPLLLFNNDKVSRHVKVEQQDSQYFHVVGPDDTGCRVAPGMTATFTVFFTPLEQKDYDYKLVVVTDRERFEVPVHAIGPRAILDFRDELHFPVCPVKASAQRSQLVRNIGSSQAKFRLQTHRPFSVTPAFGTLDVGESMQVTVDFNPMTAGNHKQDLLLHYHTGEDVYISLYGACEELNIYLEPEPVRLKDTYISLANVHTVSLTNSSDVTLQYCWTTWPCQQESSIPLFREGSELQEKEEEVERERLLMECEFDSTMIHCHPLPSTEFQELRYQDAKSNLLALSHSCITVEPMEGEIWPNTTAQFNIVFKPQEAKLYQQTIYCDITGRESHLSLTIKGEGIGPQLQLNYNLMDVKNVFIGDKNSYEVTVSNKGLIDAPFRLSNPNTTFGQYFSFRPQEGVVPPGGCQVVEVTFHCFILGTFLEDLLVTVTGQPQPLTLTFRGSVIGPTFHLNVSELNFGDIAFGFPLTLIFTLFNTSLVPMTFSLRIPGDGLRSPSLTCVKQVSELSSNQWKGSTAGDLQSRPVEFTLSPATATVRSMSDVDIKVTLCSNSVRRYRLALVVDVEGVGEEIMSLPISARCVVPELVVETPVLDFQRCFLNHTHEQNVLLANTSSLPACYGLLDQEYEESPSLLFGSSVPRGIILPHTSAEIPLRLLAKTTGRLHHTVHIAVFGSVLPPLDVVVSCIGQGPTVHIQSSRLDFGRIPVLTDITRTLHLFNHSPIPAFFTARMKARGRSQWHVLPHEGKVAAEGQLELRIVTHLRDTLHFQDKLEIAIQDSQMHIVDLSATGTGTTIVSDLPFAPSLDLGTHFSHGSCQYHFKLTNYGQRRHLMYWRSEGSSLFPQGLLRSTKTNKEKNMSGRSFLPSISASRQKDNISCGSLVSSIRDRPVFSLSPIRVELFPGCSVDMLLTGSSDCPKIVQERLECYGIVGLQGCYERIMTVDVTCHFVAPMLSISTKQLDFYIENAPGKSLVPLYEMLVFKNVSSLSLHIELSVVEPFSLCEAEGNFSSATKSIFLGNGKQAEVWVCFTPSYYQDKMSHVVYEFLQICYQGHPQQDMVELHAEVHFPNLHFSSTSVDFGCVLNRTENQRQLTMTNCSPLPVSYHWTFVVDQSHQAIREAYAAKLSVEEENQGIPANEAEEVRGSPKEPSAALSVPCSSSTVSDEQINTKQCPACVEEVFDVLPIHGQLEPGGEQLVTFSFYGHNNVSKEVVAQCEVEEGPIYEIKLRGESSEITYSLDSTHIDFGPQLFNRVGEAKVSLRNNGNVGFRFSILQSAEEEEGREEAKGKWNAQDKEYNKKNKQEEGEEVRPGRPVIIPCSGYVSAGAEHCLRALYLPGLPEVFERRFQLQVACFPPQDITLSGEGVFPRISLNLPRHLTEEHYGEVLQQARTAVEADSAGALIEPNCIPTYEELLHMEVERILVKENAVAVTNNVLEVKSISGSSGEWHKLTKLVLPEYILDFGYVIHGRVLTHSIKFTNTGSLAVSFNSNRKPLADTGFSTEFDRVKNLPCGETETFTVKFDPQGANLQMGNIRVVMPIQVAGGPTLQVLMCAVVTMPAITVSTETLHFGTVQCGMCQIMTIQLFNHGSVSCHWSIAGEVKPHKKINKFLPLHQRKLQQQHPGVFEMVPCSGMLSPKEWVNVQIKFSPDESCAYNKKLIVCVTESTQQLLIVAQGQGEEPQLEFCPSMLELGPCLPFRSGVEAEVVVKNPCPFPIEFYSLEFDTQYIEEEKILRLMQGYDEQNMLLLPPRAPGESLPPELLDYYKEYCSKIADDELKAGLCEEEPEKVDMQEDEKKLRQNNNHPPDANDKCPPTTEGIPIMTVEGAKLCDSLETRKENSVGHLEVTPVSKAIARHMGVDLSPEGLAAQNRRGIAVIVHGAPLTGKSTTAAALARHYGGTCLKFDAVVTDVLRNGTSPVSLTARQWYSHAVVEHAQERADEAGYEVSDISSASASASLTNVVDNVKVVSKNLENHRKTETSHPALDMVGDVAFVCRLFPEQLLVDILAERLQLSDCHRGVVIDGLGSVYTQSVSSTLQVVLKAFNNRKHIYVVNFSDSYTALKTRERAQREAEELALKELADKEEQWLQELDEDAYDALPEEKKGRIAQQHREQFQQQKLRERERREKELEEERLQEEKRLRDEEELKKKSKKGAKRDSKEDMSGKKNLVGKQSAATLDDRRMSHSNNSKESLVEAGEQHNSNEVLQSKKTDDSQKTGGTKQLLSDAPELTDKLEREQSSVDELQSRFIVYERSQAQVHHILQHWERAQGMLLVPLLGDEIPPMSEEMPPEKQTIVGKKTRKANSKPLSPILRCQSQMDNGMAGDKVSPVDIVPHIVLHGSGKGYPSATELLKGSALPPLEEVLDGLGLGPKGPPMPPPITFSMVPFPKNRMEPNPQVTCDCFSFLVSTESDEHAEDKKTVEEDTQALPLKDEAVTPKSRIQGSIKERKVPKDKKGKENQRSKRQTSGKSKGKSLDRSPSPFLPSTTSYCTEQIQQHGVLEQRRSQRLSKFRWVVPTKGEVVLKIWFYSESPGKFDQTFNFELLATQKRYQLTCSGICIYPSICKDYMTLFAHSKMVPKLEEGIQRAYLIKPGLFEFGPLLCNKTRDGYKMCKYPENAERLVILNNSGQDAEVQFSFQHDNEAVTYLLDPPAMTLKPDERQELTVWAYPTSLGQIKDSIVCSITDNPERVIINLSCWGVRPELKVDCTQWHFDKILLHRQASRSVVLHNKTTLPAFWRLRGVDDLGDEFSVLQDQGIILPNKMFPLTLHFKPMKPLNIKKTLRLEVYDAEKILGVIHTDNIQIIAEAYDIALDITPDGCMDFGTIKASEEVQLSLKLRNQGKYQIAYRFTLEQTNPSQPNLGSIFTVSPQHGTLMPTDKPTVVQVIARPNTEVSIREEPILHCQVIEPKIGKGGETVATLTIKVSIQSVFSRYKITPIKCIHFGPLVYGCKKSQSFTIENHGVFETRFTIYRKMKDLPLVPSGRSGGLKSQESPSGKPTSVSSKMRHDATQKDAGTQQSSTNSEYITLYLPCTSSILSSQGTVSSRKMSCLVASETKMISGLSEDRICDGIFRSLSRSTVITQAHAVESKLTDSYWVFSSAADVFAVETPSVSLHDWNRLTTGVFSVSPGTGTIPPGSQQVVTVDCGAEQLGNWNEGLVIDISDRDNSDQPEGILYRLMAEVCVPGIGLDPPTIFEEHHLCHNSCQLSSKQFCNAKGIYILNENTFFFNKVLVGQTAQARFKLINNSKVPCLLSLAIRYVASKVSRNMEVFDLSAPTLCIPSQSHTFTVVSFTPQTMQHYHAVFEASIQGATRSRMTPTLKNKVLEFDLLGEGTLPSVCVVHPALRNSRGNPILTFRRVLIGRRQTLPLVLMNDGNVSAQVKIDIPDTHTVFNLKSAPSNTCRPIHFRQLEGSDHQLVHRATFQLAVDEQAELEVSFCSAKPLKVKANITLQVEDNQYSNTIIQLTGEANQEIITLENISTSSQGRAPEMDGEGGYEVLNFGDCHVNRLLQECFTMINHSSEQALRFEWPAAGPHVSFSPQVGHLHAGCSKEVAVTFSSNQPVTLTKQPMRCKVCQVKFQQPVEQVADWDDCEHTVQWLSASNQDVVAQPQQPVKNKVIKTEPEPSCSVIEGTQMELELRISAVCDYVKFSCDTDTIHFKDTMLYQTRLHQLNILNQGNVKLEYSLQVFMDSSINHNQTDEIPSSRPSSRSAGALTAARPSTALASVMTLQMGNPELPPFSVEPNIGAVEPGASQNFSIRFSPLVVSRFQGRLVCSIPNLQEGIQCPSITVSGRSLLPHCHFDLEDSDYITGNHRRPELKGALDPHTRVIEFNSIGFSAHTTRQFSVLNPTNKDYTFKWKCEDTGPSPFHCLTPSGTILPGKKVEMCLAYASERLDVVESCWSFVIDTLSLSIPFLCVGTTQEPLVYLNRAHLDLGDLLVGRRVEQTIDLVNEEKEPFHFSVLQSSLHCEDQQSSLTLQPLTGTVAAKDRLPLSVYFMPCREGYVSFRLVLKVKRKAEPLVLAVKADGFAMSTSVQVVKPDGGFREINHSYPDTLDFGNVGLSEQSTFTLLVSNLAKFTMEVNFDLVGPTESLQHLEAKPKVATVEVGKQLHSSIFFSPKNICNLEDVKLNVKVKHGPTFILTITGRAVAPSVEFSFTKYSFGKCFLYSPGMVPASKSLVISNKGDRDISVQCQFSNTFYLEIGFQQDVLSPGSVKEIPITFFPREASRYHEKITFILNSCVKKLVDIRGQGIEMKLDVEDPKHRRVKLGSLLVGQKVKKVVTLVNHSLSDLCLSLLLNANPQDLSFSPGELNLKARGGSCNVHIQFSPQQPVANFTTELQATSAGLVRPLLTIQGCCQGVEVYLDRDHLAFGATALCGQARKKIVMMNTGDIGARFHWEVAGFPPELSIVPVKGYICPGREVPFEVTFAPVEPSNDTRYEILSCHVEHASSPITLTVTGSCIVASTTKEVVNFVCPVRGSHMQSLTVVNPTNQHCTITPVFEGEQWSAVPSLILDSLENKTYDITYQPLTMTAQGKKHQGSVFFPFPDGTSLLYSLQGTAEPPKVEDTILRELPAKTHHTELLSVHNWLSKQQRFRVVIEILKPERPDATVSLKGLEYIDVPSLAKRDYKINIHTFREGQVIAKVTFQNEASGEYLFYQVTFKMTPPDILSTIELVTVVRQVASASVQLENPLNMPISLTSECKCPDIILPSQYTVPGQSKGVLSFEYQPLHAGESTARLSMHCNELGYFHYELLLKVVPPPQEKPVYFQTPLGSSHSNIVKFINYSRSKTEYFCKLDCSDFIVEKSIVTPPGSPPGLETQVEVCFEPHQLGQVRGQLTLSSAVGGDYIFSLYGTCLPPKPQGPFSIRTGRNISIPFKNVFLQTTAFSFQVDNPCFIVKAVDNIQSKKTCTMLVTFEAPSTDSQGPWFGKVIISSQCSVGHSKSFSWVYYLKGFRSETSQKESTA
ncbi:hydrocephalus-inducing protein homolog [Genypterus blacodes]|uniref:hydrocephalus-inducing protein homolog n=1 Tax=Genypterus blacodes TaxID=154954 RepID=UPI003F760126